VGSIPRELMYWLNNSLTWMHCKSLWIKASTKCININVGEQLMWCYIYLSRSALMKKLIYVLDYLRFNTFSFWVNCSFKQICTNVVLSFYRPPSPDMWTKAIKWTNEKTYPRFALSLSGL